MSIRSLQYYALAVPDPAVGRRFYADFGLEGRENGKSVVMRCHGRAQDQVVLVEGPKRRLHHLCFGTKPELLSALKKRIEASGTKLADPPNETPGEGLWLRDPDRALLNVKAAEPAPWAAAPKWTINTPGHFTRLGKRAAPARDLKVRPRRLGHVLRFTPDMNRTVDFYTKVLGMRLSDRARDILTFLHTEGGSDHHVLAFATGDLPGFHHASFEVANVDEIGMGARNLIAKGYRNGWGFGRHMIGSNFFHYIRDPWNGLAEYFTDIDYIPAGQAWEAKDWAPEDSLYVWGPAVPEDFIANFEDAR